MYDRCQIVIPARLKSTRLPEKLLLRVGGKSVLQHTYEAAQRATRANSVIVAVDHTRLADEVKSFGGEWIMTSSDHARGTDRIAEVAWKVPNVSVFVNVQGDEPEIDSTAIDLVIQTLIDDPTADMATVGTPIRCPKLLNDPSCVKIVMGAGGRAVYFSRSVVPYSRDLITKRTLAQEPPLYWHHVGLYAYRREFLHWYTNQPHRRGTSFSLSRRRCAPARSVKGSFARAAWR